ncbi:hypothetical protein [Rhodopirellula sp. SWK7]|uniref:hypothetical protein n=1 Tax=Rhodopirellula sp. SWK7 TaxID=595460 RepID=UPI0002BE8723|nr:hypothetical protein [Rhodopirellula sp. SWK7]EMI41107.1 hypothetical protein RRSWK_06411 [Rhodopirellula sp. SWK7]
MDIIAPEANSDRLCWEGKAAYRHDNADRGEQSCESRTNNKAGIKAVPEHSEIRKKEGKTNYHHTELNEGQISVVRWQAQWDFDRERTVISFSRRRHSPIAVQNIIRGTSAVTGRREKN